MHEKGKMFDCLYQREVKKKPIQQLPGLFCMRAEFLFREARLLKLRTHRRLKDFAQTETEDEKNQNKKKKGKEIGYPDGKEEYWPDSGHGRVPGEQDLIHDRQYTEYPDR